MFVGDSLTAGCEWQELFGYQARILNRGIGGDTSLGVLKRVSHVSKLQPLAVFLMIGTNDPQGAGLSPSETIANIQAIVDDIKRASPHTLIYLQSILPSRTPKFNEWSKEVNSGISRLAGPSVVFVDLRAAFTDDDQLLATAYTHDKMHLNAAGYLLWKRQLDPLMAELLNAPKEGS